MREDQLFQLVALLSLALFIGAGVLPLPPATRRLAQRGAIAVLVFGLAAAFALFVIGG